MKRFLLTSVCLLAAATAQANLAHEFAVEAGTSVPSSAFGDDANTGFNMGAQYQIMAGRVGLGGEIKFHTWRSSDEKRGAAEIAFGPDSDYRFAAWQYTGYGVAVLPVSSARPYLKLGAGWYAPNTERVSPASGDVREYDVSFGYQVGAGVDFDAGNNLKVGLGAAYHQIKDTERDFVTVTGRVIWPVNLGFPR